MHHIVKKLKDINRRRLFGVSATLLLILSGVYVLTALTPECRDDFYHKYVSISETEDKRVESFMDIINYIPRRYMHKAGRAFINIMEYSFTGLLGKSWFNCVNPVFFAVFISSLTLLWGKVTSLNLLFSLSVVLFLFPIFSETFLWLSGSINYLWPCTFICIFLLFLLKYNQSPAHSAVAYLWAIPCLLIGCTHEGLTVPLALSLLLSIIIFRKPEFTRFEKVLAGAFVLGALFCFFAPGNFARVENYGREVITLGDRIRAGFKLLIQLRAFYILLVCLVSVGIYRLIKYKDSTWIRQFYWDNCILINSLIFSFPFLFVSGQTGKRVMAGPEFYSIILILILIKQLKPSTSRWIKYPVILTSIPLWIGIFYFSVINNNAQKDINEKIESHKSEIIVYDPVSFPAFFPRYVVTAFWSYESAIKRIYHKDMAKYYNYDNLVFMPRRFYEIIITDKLPLQRSEQNGLPYYILPLNNRDTIRNVNDGNYEIAVNDGEYKFRVPQRHSEILQIGGRRYLFLMKGKVNETLVDEMFSKVISFNRQQPQQPVDLSVSDRVVRIEK